MPTERRVRRALLSVSDKSGLVEFARGLIAAGVELVSTGGTAAALRTVDLPTREVSELTRFQEMMGGRVKTLHPAIHGAILARRGTDDDAVARHGIEPIDLVAVNLYPFEAASARGQTGETELMELIDIGGPALIRAAAKNWPDVVVVVDPTDYPGVLASLAGTGTVPRAERRRLAARAFARTAAYDGAIAAWFEGEGQGRFPACFAPRFKLRAELRYGENPHQRAALYAEPGAGSGTIVGARLLQGKPLSFNNLADADAALALVGAFEEPACVIVKHLNPCGVALGGSTREAYLAALAGDPVSAFGGIVAFNRSLDAETADAMLERQFVEVVVAPEIGAPARDCLAGKPNLRVLATGGVPARAREFDFRRLAGGLLLQDADHVTGIPAESAVVSRRRPDARERADLDFAWRVVQGARSNAIVLARERATLGIAAGQTSRVFAVRTAGMKAREAGHDLEGAVLASDAFLPFRDNVDEAARLGARAIVQPGGSRRDSEVIAAADEHGLTMLFTRRRHFRH